MKKVAFVINVNDEEKEYVKSHTHCELDFIDRNSDPEVFDQYDMIAGNVPKDIFKASKVNYMHAESAGVNQYLDLLPGKTLTCSSGAYGEVISEYMLTNVLLFTTRMKQYLEASQYHKWECLGKIRAICDLKVLVVGCGDIGSSFARKMSLLGATVDGVKRNTNVTIEGIRKLYTQNDLKDILGNYDVVALCLPLTDETLNLFDYDLMKTMKKDAILLNVGRGKVIHTPSLIKLLKEGYFNGVYLDVVDQEPLPMNSYLWNDDKVIITPHISGGYSLASTFKKVLDIAIENINRYCEDKPLLNQTDPDSGYAKR